MELIVDHLNFEYTEWFNEYYSVLSPLVLTLLLLEGGETH